jgi:Zn-dependent oligopeptidase
MVQNQILGFKDLAEKQLKEKLDKKIDDIADIIDRIKEGVEEAKAKQIKYGLKSLKKEFEDLEQVAKELGIEASDKFSLISQMIQQAIGILQ